MPMADDFARELAFLIGRYQARGLSLLVIRETLHQAYRRFVDAVGK